MDFHMELAIRIFLSMVVGAVIGLERALRGKPAGIRTHALVCIGSALAMVLSTMNEGQFRDPMRLAAQVISGIGFIGAGVIWMDSKNVKRGLTTAANLWITSILGLTIGYGAFDIALVTLLSMWIAINIPRWLKWFGIDVNGKRIADRKRKDDSYDD